MSDYEKAVVSELRRNAKKLGVWSPGRDDMLAAADLIEKLCAERDAVEVEPVSEKIIRKKSEVSDYWMNDVKQYRATQGYSDIEHDVDDFLRGYNEAVEDMLAILYGEQKDGDGECSNGIAINAKA